MIFKRRALRESPEIVKKRLGRCTESKNAWRCQRSRNRLPWL